MNRRQEMEKKLSFAYKRRAYKRRDSIESVINVEKKRAKHVLKLLHVDLSENKVLDVGCGLGICMKMLKDKGAKVIGLDLNLKGKEYFNLDIRKFDLNSGRLPFNGKTFNFVVCTEVLEHVFYPHFLLKEIKRVLQDDGMAILSMPNSFEIRSRIKFLLGKKLQNHVIDTYGHHYLTSLDLIKDFIQGEFRIIDYKCEWNKYGRIVGPLWKLFLSFFPIRKKIESLFAINIIMRCAKKSD